MFYLTLPFVLVVIGSAISAGRRAPRPIRWQEFVGVGGVTTFMGFSLFASPVVVGVFVLLGAALVVWYFTRERLRTFIPLLVVAVAIPYGLVGWSVLERNAEYDHLRQEYPLESLAGGYSSHSPSSMRRSRTPIRRSTSARSPRASVAIPSTTQEAAQQAKAAASDGFSVSR